MSGRVHRPGLRAEKGTLQDRHEALDVELLSACAAHDPDRAAAALRAHLELATDIYAVELTNGADKTIPMWSFVWWPHALARGHDPLDANVVWMRQGIDLGHAPPHALQLRGQVLQRRDVYVGAPFRVRGSALSTMRARPTTRFRGSGCRSMNERVRRRASAEAGVYR